MGQGTTIKISVIYEEHVYDFEVPNGVSIARLRELLTQVFVEMRLGIPAHFDLMLLNKHLTVNESVALNRYPISHGDQFRIMPR